MVRSLRAVRPETRTYRPSIGCRREGRRRGTGANGLTLARYAMSAGRIRGQYARSIHERISHPAAQSTMAEEAVMAKGNRGDFTRPAPGPDMVLCLCGPNYVSAYLRSTAKRSVLLCSHQKHSGRNYRSGRTYHTGRSLSRGVVVPGISREPGRSSARLYEWPVTRGDIGGAGRAGSRLAARAVARRMSAVCQTT